MSNPSLREQLAALSGQSGEEAANSRPSIKPASPKPSPRNPRLSAKTAPPPWLERARYGVELLKAHFPLCFGTGETLRPLKTGIRQDLVKQLGGREDITIDDKACMVSSLSYYVNLISYHQSALEGAERIDLEGCIAGKVTAEEAAYSKQRLTTKQQKRQLNSQSKSRSSAEAVHPTKVSVKA